MKISELNHLINSIPETSRDAQIKLLQTYLQTGLHNDGDIFLMRRFLRYAAAQTQNLAKLFSFDYFNQSELFSFLMQTDRKLSFGHFEIFPEEIRQHIENFLDIKSFARLTRASSLFYRDFNQPFFWKLKCIEICSLPELMSDVISMGAIKHYKNLYRAYTQVPLPLRENITEPWQLLCLSGESAAFDYATQYLYLKKHTRGRGGENVLHYCSLSGVMAQVDKALHLVCFSSKADDEKNVLHYSVLSGKTQLVIKILELEKQKSIRLKRTTNKGQTVLHFAAWVGSPDLVELALKETCDPLECDKNGEHALHYALKGGNQMVIAKLREFNYRLEEIPSINP